MTTNKPAKEVKVIRLPRSPKRVIKVLEMALKDARRKKYIDVVVVLNADDHIIVDGSGISLFKAVGLCEYAKDDLLSRLK